VAFTTARLDELIGTKPDVLATFNTNKSGNQIDEAGIITNRIYFIKILFKFLVSIFFFLILNLQLNCHNFGLLDPILGYYQAIEQPNRS